VATFFALYFLYRIAEKYYGLKVARATVLTFAFFPTAFFLNAVYTEALFVALSAGSFWAAAVRRDPCSLVSWELWPPRHATSGCFCSYP
jgi:Gpi18-like mannosyltransferase